MATTRQRRVLEWLLDPATRQRSEGEYPQWVRDESAKMVKLNNDNEWSDDAMNAVMWCAHNLPSFTVDDVVARMGNRNRVHELRALGPVMKRAKALGFVSMSDASRPALRASRRGARLRVWWGARQAEGAQPRSMSTGYHD